MGTFIKYLIFVPLKYHAGPWGGCDALCGKGVRKRQVTCYEKNENGTIVKLEDDACTAVEDLEEPEAEEECSAEKECETYDWITTPWVGCKDEGEGEASPSVCGLGMLFVGDLIEHEKRIG